MGLTINGQKFSPIPQGVFTGAAREVYQLGPQTSAIYGTTSSKIGIVYEIGGQYRSNGEPSSLIRVYTETLSQKSNLYRDLRGILGRELTPAEADSFDIDMILGKPCQLQIGHVTREGKTRAVIQGIFACQAGTAFNLVFPKITYRFNDPIPEACPAFLKQMIEESPDFGKADTCTDVPAEATAEEPF